MSNNFLLIKLHASLTGIDILEKMILVILCAFLDSVRSTCKEVHFHQQTYDDNQDIVCFGFRFFF